MKKLTKALVLAGVFTVAALVGTFAFTPSADAIPECIAVCDQSTGIGYKCCPSKHGGLWSCIEIGC